MGPAGGCPARHIFDRKESYGRVMDKYEGEARKNKGKIQEKVSQMKNQGGTYLCEMRGLEGRRQEKKGTVHTEQTKR